MRLAETRNLFVRTLTFPADRATVLDALVESTDDVDSAAARLSHEIEPAATH